MSNALEVEEIAQLRETILDLLDQFGHMYTISCVENACAMLDHPLCLSGYDGKRNVWVGNTKRCYCSAKIYGKWEE